MTQPSVPLGFDNPLYDNAPPSNNIGFVPEQPIHISENELREIPMKNEKGKRIFKEKNVKKMVFNAIDPSFCYLYALETFTETRRIEQAHEPCQNPYQPAWSEAPPPYIGNFNPWEISIRPDADFVKHIKIMEIPNSSRVQKCNECQSMGSANCRDCVGSGFSQCKKCHGSGRIAFAASHYGCHNQNTPVHPTDCIHCKGRGIEDCNFCSGNRRNCIHCNSRGYKNCFFCNNDGHLNCIHFNACHSCQGGGRKNCTSCHGRGRNICATCNGCGNIRCFSKLVVEYDINKSDYFTGCDVPEAKLRRASGNVILAEENLMITPIKNFKIQEINAMSNDFFAIHMQKSQNMCRIIKQRHSIVAIPVTKVHYKLGSNDDDFWLFGSEHFCYTIKEKSCCSII